MRMSDAANLADKILKGNNRNKTPYQNVRENIRSVFNSDFPNLSYKSKIQIRLALIDGYYSTNMSKRLFGIEEIADKIVKEGNNKHLKKAFKSFIEKDNKKIKNIFNKKYGLQKDGKNSPKRAISLISKYAYYLTEYQFPIYDRLVKENIWRIIKHDTENCEAIKVRKKNITRQMLESGFLNYFKYMKFINEKSKIKDFNKLDKLGWLFGQIKEARYIAVLNSNKYTEFMKYWKKHQRPSERININLVIHRIFKNKRIKNNFAKKYTKELVDFIDYVFIITPPKRKKQKNNLV